MRTVEPQVLLRMGCGVARRMERGNHPRDALVVLAFGRPRHRFGLYGASLFRDRFAPTYNIGRGARSFALGFAGCAGGDGGSSLRIVVGTSNYGREVSWHHGRAWAVMVNGVNDALQDAGVASRVDVVGGNDIELSWNGPRVSKAWVRGYDSANQWPYYNFGDAAGCPPKGSCAGAWTLEDVWWVSWGAAPAIPLPQVYTNSGSMARQWYNLSLYSKRRHGERMAIAGVMSQHHACRQSRDPCRGMSNTPRKAFVQLSRALNSDPRTAQRIRWVTDIGWRHR